MATTRSWVRKRGSGASAERVSSSASTTGGIRLENTRTREKWPAAVRLLRYEYRPARPVRTMCTIRTAGRARVRVECVRGEDGTALAWGAANARFGFGPTLGGVGRPRL